MASLPYITAPGNVDKALIGIKRAAVPESVSQDFVKTILKIPGGSGAQITSFLKKLGLANTDGTPSDLYRKFRNPPSSGSALASAIKHGYKPLFTRNEFADQLDDSELLELIVEETGEGHDSSPVKLIFNCFKRLRSFARFDANDGSSPVDDDRVDYTTQRVPTTPDAATKSSGIGLNLGYTINLNLPASTDPAVFDAIFRSLKQNLLTDDDA